MDKVFLNEGDVHYAKGSGKKPYEIKKVGGVVSCSCPAWRNIGGPIDVRVCKHIRATIDSSCLLPQALKQYGDAKAKPTKKEKGAKKAAVKKDTAPPVLLAHSWENEDPKGWWMSEKLDGVRAWWDGENFISRLGNVFHAPQWFKDHLPKDVVLDGELFAGRKNFQKTISAVRKLVPNDDEWKGINYVVFDAPKTPGTFEERMKFLASLFDDAPISTRPVYRLTQMFCANYDYMKLYLDIVEKNGGEGVMLREAGSLYEEGRSRTLLKVKTFWDAEGVVVGHNPGKGKNKGRLGSLEILWEGKTFNLSGMTDKQRENPAPLGTVITFRATDLTDKGIPKFASFVSARDYE